MKVSVFAIFDTKAEAFGQPFFTQTAGLAARSFGQACSNTETDYNKYPLDFILYELGEYDDETGKIESLNPMEICSASQAIKAARKEAKAYEEKIREETLEENRKEFDPTIPEDAAERAINYRGPENAKK